jgi:long-chain acyl-CoA synthetase
MAGMSRSRKIFTLKDMLHRSAKLYANQTAFYLPSQTKNATVTYRQFADDVDALGTALIGAKKKGKRIGIIGKNSYEWGLVYFAVMNGAGIVVSLDKELTTQELRDSIERVNIDTMFYSDDVAEKVLDTKKQGIVKTYISMSPSSEGHTIYQLVDEGRQLMRSGKRDYRRITIDPDAVAALLFTSGTTSQSKIVMLSHRNITSDLINGVAPFNLKNSDKFLSILPMHHMFECTAGFLAPLYSGCSIYFSQGIRHIGQEFKEQKPTVIVCVPRVIDALSVKIWKGIREQKKEQTVRRVIVATNFLDRLGLHLKRNLFAKIHVELGGNIRFFLSGAAGINQKTAEDMTDLGFTIFQGYGLTECSPAIAISYHGNNDMDSVGPPLAETEVLIHKPDGEGNGEILVKGPQVMLGYYHDSAATKRSFYKGYFRTGDVGHIKENGSLKIIGRQKNVIVTSGGKKIYPEELESLLLQCSAVKDVVVHGIEHNHGMQICASIVLIDSNNALQRRSYEKLARSHVQTINGDLAKYEQIHTIEIRDVDFIRTSTLKVKRHLLAKIS